MPMRAPKEKLRITVVPSEALPAGISANDVALLLARLIGRQIAREQAARAVVRKPSPPSSQCDNSSWKTVYTYNAGIAIPAEYSPMPTVGALEFQRKFGEFQHRAQREPVEITRHGRREYVLMSADHYDWFRAAAQRSHRTEDVSDVVLAAVERAEMDPEHAPLDELLK
mgnify:CR=1 FL=1